MRYAPGALAEVKEINGGPAHHRVAAVSVVDGYR
jgi:hypothetical protein